MCSLLQEQKFNQNIKPNTRETFISTSRMCVFSPVWPPGHIQSGESWVAQGVPQVKDTNHALWMLTLVNRTERPFGPIERESEKKAHRRKKEALFLFFYYVIGTPGGRIASDNCLPFNSILAVTTNIFNWWKKWGSVSHLFIYQTTHSMCCASRTVIKQKTSTFFD